MSERDVGIDVRDVPAAVRQAVEDDARARDVSLNDAAGQVLATRYGLAWVTRGYPYSGTSGEANQWLLRVPKQMRDVIRQHAEASGNTMRGVILLALELHYGLPPTSARKRGGKQLDPQVVAQVRARNAAGESIRSLAREFGIKRETLAKAIRA